jgi:hypothetical protein
MCKRCGNDDHVLLFVGYIPVRVYPLNQSQKEARAKTRAMFADLEEIRRGLERQQEQTEVRDKEIGA